MRKVTTNVVSAFLRGEAYKESNSQTDGQSLWLHFNKIAEHNPDGLYITDCGWQTKTTGERLNALPGVNLSRRKGEWILNGEKWSGEWVRVNKNKPPVADSSVTGSMFDLTIKWISTGGYRGQEQPIYAVCAANNTGMWSDSPCPTEVCLNELIAARKAIKAVGIPVKEVVCSTSNVFCSVHYLVVPPKHVDKAREVVDKHLTEELTTLLYKVG
jgi:hypothetical protein